MALQAARVSGIFRLCAPGMMKETSGHIVIHLVQKDKQHAEGIVTIMSDKAVKALRE